MLNLGEQLERGGVEAEGVWQLELVARLGVDATSGGLVSLLLGGAFFAPLLAVAATVSRLWAEAFARMRKRPLDAGWFYSAWLFVLLAPPTLPLHYAAIGMSFGVLFGSHVFGGAGRYVANPALVAMLFTGLAYPDLLAVDGWLPGSSAPTTWSTLANGATAGVEWWPVFLGREVGAFGAPSALACLAGAAYLAARGTVSWRVVAGALLGLAAVSTLAGPLAWHWHLALGSFALALAFVATDPSVVPATRVGSWAYGALFGALTVVLRVANPEHPESTLAALLLAMLCAPLCDTIALAIRRRCQAVAPDA